MCSFYFNDLDACEFGFSAARAAARCDPKFAIMHAAIGAVPSAIKRRAETPIPNLWIKDLHLCKGFHATCFAANVVDFAAKHTCAASGGFYR